MPPSDQEPRYQLVDSNGNVVGSLFGDGSGNVVIADETDTQTTFGPDGITTPALEAGQVNRAGRSEPTKFEEVSNDSVITLEHIARPLIKISAVNAGGIFVMGFDSIVDIGSNNLNVVGADQTLDGTTGPDNELNVSNNDNVVYIENRTGEAIKIKVMAQ